MALESGRGKLLGECVVNGYRQRERAVARLDGLKGGNVST